VPMSVWLAFRRPRLAVLALPLAIAALTFQTGLRWSPQERMANLARGHFPVAALDFMEQTGLALPSDVTPRWAGYVLYRLHPPATVLVDGRLLFNAQVADLIQRRQRRDFSTFDDAVDKFNVRLVLRPTRFFPPLAEERWWLAYRDPIAEVWLPRAAWTEERMARIRAWYDRRSPGSAPR